jgi:hypothetical protein
MYIINWQLGWKVSGQACIQLAAGSSEDWRGPNYGAKTEYKYNGFEKRKNILRCPISPTAIAQQTKWSDRPVQYAPLPVAQNAVDTTAYEVTHFKWYLAFV